MMFVDRAAVVLLRGGVIAYPTEGVFGLGCLPDNLDAIARVLRIKQRNVHKGLILLAARCEQLRGWIDTTNSAGLPSPNPDAPITWIVPCGERVNDMLRGNNAGVAVRLTTNPVAKALSNAVNSPIVSTSANLSGHPVARNQVILRRQFGRLVDYVVPGRCGPASGASEIRDLQTGQVLRQGGQ